MFKCPRLNLAVRRGSVEVSRELVEVSRESQGPARVDIFSFNDIFGNINNIDDFGVC